MPIVSGRARWGAALSGDPSGKVSVLRIRYVDGSGVLPAGVQVGILEGVREVSVLLDLAACPTLLMDALSQTVTEWAHERWLYGGPGEVREYVYELAVLPGEWARVVCAGGACRVLVDLSGPVGEVLGAMSREVSAAARRSWLWLGPSDVLVA